LTDRANLLNVYEGCGRSEELTFGRSSAANTLRPRHPEIVGGHAQEANVS